MRYDKLKSAAYDANKELARAGLVVMTFGNVSAADRAAGVFAIKPSGADYDTLKPEDMVVVSLDTGRVVDGTLRPSSDTPTHLALYRAFESVGGIVHTHSRYATAWAQSGREIPCLGTTHADHFRGSIPLTRRLAPGEVGGAYEENTGRVIVERFSAGALRPDEMPGVLVASHGPFAWGPDAKAAVENAVLLEEVARMAFLTMLLDPSVGEIERALLDKHFLRKHGPGAYYGQKS